jgi:uncharacterized repeat protein (TIGR01451 family)
MQQSTIKFLSSIAVALICGAGLPDALAQKATVDTPRRAAEPLQISLVRSKVVVENGKDVMQSAAVAQPGDILEEVATYTNTSTAVLKNVEATLPVPPNTELVMASVKPATAKASVDGKNFSKVPLTRKVRQANGVEIEQPVPLSEYRYLRWFPGDLAPAKPLSFSARFVVANSPVSGNSAGK